MELPKEYDAKAVEAKWKLRWTKDKTYAHAPGKSSVTIDTPPPTVSGRMHIGHASSYSQQDFYARYHRMRTGKVFFPFGTDDNGLATERLVEKTKGVKSAKMSRKEFRELCLSTIKELKPDFVQDWKDIGMSCDFDTTYSTIDERCQALSQRSFIELYKAGHVFREESPVAWCVQCQTAIAQAEFENVDMQSAFNDIAFDCNGKKLVIATTRPELIPACVAVAAHPADDRYEGLKGKFAKVPVTHHEVPIIFDEKVEMEKGTGLMMVCTFGDKEDIEKWHVHDLALRVIFTKDGRLNSLAGKYEGLAIKDARKAILAELEADGALLRQQQITHAVNVHERCGTEIEFLKTWQWYIRILDKKERLLEAANEIAWHPAHMKVRYDHWVENLNWDWCISRQRSFGVPFPVWHAQDGEIVLANESQLPVDPFVDRPKGREEEDLLPEEDVMDTWATSSITPQIALDWNDALIPMTVRPQAHDIIRTWAFYTITKSVLHHDTVPWKHIAISGFVTDPHGRKMSKSKGNVVAPQDVLEKYGADAIRFWAAGAKLGDDIPYMEKELVTGKKTVTKLWNASRFVLPHLEGFTKHDGDLALVDRWLLDAYAQLVEECTAAFERYDHSRARFLLEQFFWGTLCDNYLEIAKGRLYEPRTPSDKSSAQHALRTVLEGLLRLFAPFMPFITEEIYQHIGAGSVHLTQWPTVETSWKDEEARLAGEEVVQVVQAARKWKSDRKLSMGAPIPALSIASVRDLSGAEYDLTSVTRAEKVSFSSAEFSVDIRDA